MAGVTYSFENLDLYLETYEYKNVVWMPRFLKPRMWF